MFCSKCGYVAGDGDKFCVRCGSPLVVPMPPAANPELAAVAEPIVNEADEAFAEAAEEVKPEVVNEAAEAAAEELKPIEEAVCEEAAEVKETVREIEEIAEEPIPEPVSEPIPDVNPEPIPAPAIEPEPKHECGFSRLDKPLTVWGYIWRILLFAIPVVNIIPLFVMAFSSGINKNSKNFASAVLVLLLIGLIIMIGVLIYLLATNDATTISDFIHRTLSAITGK